MNMTVNTPDIETLKVLLTVKRLYVPRGKDVSPHDNLFVLRQFAQVQFSFL